MKKRLLSFALAVTMLFGSVNVAFADETSVPEANQVVAEEVTPVADDTESGGAVEDTTETTTEATESTGPNWATTSPWQATVFGDCGGQERIDNYGNLASTDAYPNQDGVYVYNVEELDNNSVNVRMGIPNYSNSSDTAVSQGKIAGGSEGIVYYYQQITEDEDFTLSATAHVNGICNTNSQVSFGATVRDTVVPLDGKNSKLVGDSISAAVLDMDKLGSAEAGKSLRFAYYRQGGSLTKFDSAATKNPDVGDDIEVSITKVGSNYTLKFGDEVTVVNADEAGISLTDDVYVGFFASRCADITFSNVKYDNGEVEVGDWQTNGNGLNGKPDSFGNLIDKSSTDGSSFDLSIINKAVGKLSGSEDSYFYRAVKTTADEDFSITSNIDEITLGTVSSGNENQMAAGFIVFDQHYVKDMDVEGADAQAADGNSMFVGVMPASKGADAQYNLVVRVKKNGSVTTNETLISNGLGTVGNTVKDISLSVKRSGNTVKVIANDVSRDIDITDVFTHNQYIGYMIARDGNIKVSNNELVVGSRRVSSVKIETMPEKTEYYATQSFDTTGLSFRVEYADGGSEIVSDPSGYSLIGFDDAANQSFNTIGDKIVQASIGGVLCDIPITVRPMKVISISVDYTPIYDTFYVGGKFNFTGLQVSAKFEDGTSRILESDEYDLSIGDTKIVPNETTITEDMVSPDVPIFVRYTSENEAIDPAGETGVFYVAIDPGKLTGLRIKTYSFKTAFYIGDEYDQTGLTVQGVYTNGNTTKYQLVSSDIYEVVGFDSSKVNEKLTLRIQLKDDPSIYTTYTVSVLEATPSSIDIQQYPRLTYSVDETFDGSGSIVGVRYTNRRTEILDNTAIYYKNGAEYYKVYENNVRDENENILFEKGQRVEVTEAELNNADFYYDLTNYNNSETGITQALIYVNERYGTLAEYPVELDLSVVESSDYVWKATLFGASVFGTGDDKESSSITVNYANGTTGFANRNGTTATPSLMENGTLQDVDSVNIRSWDGSGKITGDHDGIAYYYTKVNPNNNFTLSADVTVNNYIVDPDNFTASQKAQYDSYIAQGNSHSVALDMMRTGQEAFGIMARDIVPMTGGMVDGKYMGNNNNISNVASEALHDDYTFTKADGSTVTYNLPVDAYESYVNDIAVVDEKGNSHIAKAGADNPSNMVVAGGISDSSWPKDPSSSSYYEKSTMNRITIMSRYNADRVGFYATTDKLPEKGEKYNITLTKTNTGYMITTYDYQNETTRTQYLYEAVEDISNVLTRQDADNIYVGFFAARWADITVENIELYETQTATDPYIYGSVDETVAPKITVSSNAYTSHTNYDLKLKSNSSDGVLGGLTSISLNGKNVYEDVIVGNDDSTFSVELVPNSVNQFSVVYYPNTADTGFTSYDPVITRFTVTHKGADQIYDMNNIYVAPNGSLSGDGSRNNPLTLEMALDLIEAGGKVIMLDGTYNLTNEYEGGISIESSGKYGGRYKSLVADEGANPVIDLEKEFAGFSVDADYWYFKGFSVINSKDNSNGFVLGGKHCVVENCTFVNNGDTGMQISRVNSDNNNIYSWPSYNLIKGCESYNNHDPSENNADGFAAKLTVGYGNVFQDCIAHHNVDDGWDLYTKIDSGAIGPVVLENCITYRNGYMLDETTGTDSVYTVSPEGNGFKMGGESIYVEHMLKDCISFGNLSSGVNSNNNPAMIVRNVIAYNNAKGNFNLKSGSTAVLTDSEGNTTDAGDRPYKFNYDLKGAVSVAGSDSIGSWNDDMSFGNVSATPIDSEINYLAKTGTNSTNSLGEAIDPSTFFVSTDQSTSLNESMRYNRNADGSFNHGDFLARAIPYEHDAADIVTLPDANGGEGGVGLGVTTEVTTENTEVTTKAPSRGSSGAGGGGSVKNYVATTTTTEGTTSEVVEEDTTEATTESVVFTDSVSVQVGSKDIKVNDSTYTMDVAPYIQTSSNSTMVPLRFVSIALAGESVATADSSDLIVWDAATKTATITAGSNTIVFTAGSGTYTANGVTLNISNQAVAEIVDGRMFVPFRTIGEALGAEVSWDANTKTAMYN